jgi:hypothetical protein
VGDERLEALSFVFDGGVGLQGGFCGAIAGAILGSNLLLGLDIRGTSYYQSVRAFIVGDINLLRNKRILTPESFNVGKQIIEQFIGTTGSMECDAITGRKFNDWSEYQGCLKSSVRCKKLIASTINEASRATEMCKPMVVCRKMGKHLVYSKETC